MGKADGFGCAAMVTTFSRNARRPAEMDGRPSRTRQIERMNTSASKTCIYLLHVEFANEEQHAAKLATLLASLPHCRLTRQTFLIYASDFSALTNVVDAALNHAGVFYLLANLSRPIRRIEREKVSAVTNWLTEHSN